MATNGKGNQLADLEWFKNLPKKLADLRIARTANESIWNPFQRYLVNEKIEFLETLQRERDSTNTQQTKRPRVTINTSNNIQHPPTQRRTATRPHNHNDSDDINDNDIDIQTDNNNDNNNNMSESLLGSTNVPTDPPNDLNNQQHNHNQQNANTHNTNNNDNNAMNIINNHGNEQYPGSENVISEMLQQQVLELQSKIAAIESKPQSKYDEFYKQRSKLEAQALFEFKPTLGGNEDIEQTMRYIHKLKEYIIKLEKSPYYKDDLVVEQIKKSFVNQLATQFQETPPSDPINSDKMINWIVFHTVTNRDPRKQLRAQLTQPKQLPGNEIEEIKKLVQQYESKLKQYKRICTLIAAHSVSDVHKEWEITETLQSMALFHALPIKWQQRFKKKWDLIPTTLSEMVNNLDELYKILKKQQQDELYYNNEIQKFSMAGGMYGNQPTNDPTFTGHETPNQVNFITNSRRTRTSRSYTTQNNRNADTYRTNPNNNNNNNNGNNVSTENMEQYYFEGHCTHTNGHKWCGFWGHKRKDHVWMTTKHMEICHIFTNRNPSQKRLNSNEFRKLVPEFQGGGFRGGRGRGRNRGGRGGYRGNRGYRGRGGRGGYRGRGGRQYGNPYGGRRKEYSEETEKTRKDAKARSEMNRRALVMAQTPNLDIRSTISKGLIDTTQLSDRTAKVILDSYVKADAQQKQQRQQSQRSHSGFKRET